MSQDDFDTLTNLSFVTFKLPFPSGKRSSLIGSAKAQGSKKGIYIFTNLITGEKRVGSSMNLGRRISEHLQAINSKGSEIMAKNIVIYGIDNFSHACGDTPQIIFVPNTTSQQALLCLEQYYILKYAPALNYLHAVNPSPNVVVGMKMPEERKKVVMARVVFISTTKMEIYYSTVYPLLNLCLCVIMLILDFLFIIVTLINLINYIKVKL